MAGLVISVAERFTERKCAPGKLARLPGTGVVEIESAKGFERVVQVVDYDANGILAARAFSVSVQDLISLE